MPRPAAPVRPPVVCTVAGSDSGGGAGIQADLKTMEAGGAFGTSVVTSVTAQNTTGVEGTHVLPVDEVDAQFGAVADDFDLAAVKTGLLATREVVELVSDRLRDVDAPAVVDPVMVAAAGDRLLEEAAEAAYEDLVAEATLVTPNVDEAEVLTDRAIGDPEDAEAAGDALLALGADAALVKGGHLGGEAVVDVLVTEDTVQHIHHPRVDTDASHGSGCMLSSAIATRLAHGDDLEMAVEAGVDLLGRAIRYNVDVGEGPGAVHHLVGLRDRAARQPTEERVAEIVRQFVDRDVSRLVPEVGMNVVGATPYAEGPSDTAAVEGRITKTLDGVAPNRGIRMGASSHVARFLLAIRETDADQRFAADCRFDDAVEAGLDALEGPVAEFDRDAEPQAVKESEGSTMGWGARQAMASVGGTPVAVVDRGEVGKEAIVKLLAPDSATLVDRTVTLLEAVEAD
ncbi:bifunctional hydroxymethylpyrimidine kinase/phosphomethylpyrimidine kinase [Halobacteriales archaeon Cl-PHB]